MTTVLVRGENIVTGEQSWSVPGDRHWRGVATLESIGAVEVSTCRPWFDSERKRDYYETCLFWGNHTLVVHTYGDAIQAHTGHDLWCDAELIAETMIAARRGEWIAAHTTGLGDWPALDITN